MKDVKLAVNLLWRLHRRRRKAVSQTNKARQRDRKATLQWGWQHQIRGVGVGYKRVAGHPDLTVPCIAIYVHRKTSRARLPKAELIPERLYLASFEKEFLTDIIEMPNRLRAHSAANIQPGDEVAHQFGATGTLGLLVRKGAAGAILAASCSHVIGRAGVQAKKGDLVEHPSLPPLNHDFDRNRFGTLTDTFTRLNQFDSFDQDFALAEVEVPHLAPLATTGVLVDSIADPGAGFSPGLATGLQGIRNPNARGEITNPSWNGTVADVPFAGDVQYENLVLYSTPCAVGDSGGVVLEFGTSTALGLHIGGSPDGLGVFMPLRPVFESLGLSLVSG